jgi:hypothetical protein
MKQLIITLSLAAVLMTACGGESKKTEALDRDSIHDTAAPALKEFKTFTLSDQLCFIVDEEDPVAPEFKTTGVKEKYSIVCPEKGMMTDDAMAELADLYFGSGASSDFREAASAWRKKIIESYSKPVKSFDEDLPHSYAEMSSSCRQDSNLATFIISYANYNVGAAHGMHSVQYVTVDVETGNIIHLPDLIDTSRLGYAVARAIQDLDVNSDTRECLFDEYQNVDVMPSSYNFFIDSTRSTINIVYELYHITPYCCGIQTVVLPIFWLSKHLTLTPYAKRLFGPDSYIKE